VKNGDPKFTVLVSIWIPARTFRPVDAGALLPKRWRWRWIRRGSPSMPSSRRRDRRWLVRHAGVILRAILTEYGIKRIHEADSTKGHGSIKARPRLLLPS